MLENISMNEACEVKSVALQETTVDLDSINPKKSTETQETVESVIDFGVDDVREQWAAALTTFKGSL